MLFDTIGTTDSVEAVIVTEVVPPNHPCPLCGKETSKSPERGWRSCSRCKAPIFVSLTQQEIDSLEQLLRDANSRAERAEELLRKEQEYVHVLAQQLDSFGRRRAPRPG